MFLYQLVMIEYYKLNFNLFNFVFTYISLPKSFYRFLQIFYWMVPCVENDSYVLNHIVIFLSVHM